MIIQIYKSRDDSSHNITQNRVSERNPVNEVKGDANSRKPVRTSGRNGITTMALPCRDIVDDTTQGFFWEGLRRMEKPLGWPIISKSIRPEKVFVSIKQGIKEPIYMHWRYLCSSI